MSELLDENLGAVKTELGEGERMSDVREAVKDNFDVKIPGEEFELIKNTEKEVNLNKKKYEEGEMKSALNVVTEKRVDCPITKIELNEIRDYAGKIQDGRGSSRPND